MNSLTKWRSESIAERDWGRRTRRSGVGGFTTIYQKGLDDDMEDKESARGDKGDSTGWTVPNSGRMRKDLCGGADKANRRTWQGVNCDGRAGLSNPDRLDEKRHWKIGVCWRRGHRPSEMMSTSGRWTDGFVVLSGVTAHYDLLDSSNNAYCLQPPSIPLKTTWYTEVPITPRERVVN